MKILSRTQFGNPILRAKAKQVSLAYIKTTTFKNLVKQMFYTMHRVHGVGLAAPQIGKSMSMAVIQAPGIRRVIVNPKILSHSKKTLTDWEGCLSFNDARGEVPRWESIAVRYINEKGEKVTEVLHNFHARIFQHEIDHLNGLVYVDRMTDMKTLMTHEEFMKRIVK